MTWEGRPLREDKMIPVDWEVVQIRREGSPVVLHDTSDFTRTYTRYADILEIPRMMHEAVGVQLIASVLNANGVRIPHGGLSYSLDLWIVLLSGSGGGRSTLVRLADPLLDSADLRGLVRNTQWGSAPAFYQQMAEHPTGLFVWGELSEKFKLLNDSKFGGLKQWLTDRYDNFWPPEAITYRETQKTNQNTPPIIFEKAPRTNILATSSEDWFFNNLEQGDGAGGFIPRWLLVRAAGPTRIIPTPLVPDSTLLPGLISRLKQIDALRGNADISDILPYYEKWYRAARERFAKQPNPALADAYFNRHRGHILKLAVIYEASRSLSLRPAEASWKRAESAAKWLETTIFSLLSTGMSGEGYALRKMEVRIQSAGADGLALADFTRAFQHDDLRRRQGRLVTLKSAGTVQCFRRRTSGREATILVHHDFVADYQTKNPDDRLIE